MEISKTYIIVLQENIILKYKPQDHKLMKKITHFLHIKYMKKHTLLLMWTIIIVLQINVYPQIEIEETDSVLINDTLNYNNNDTILVWDENYRLQVTDFLSQTKKIKKAFAYVTTHIKVKICLNEKENRIRFYVSSILLRNKSWISDKTEKISDQVFIHEQIHFDISELYARKLKKDIDKKIGKNYSNYKIKKLKKIINKNFYEEDKYNEYFHKITRGFRSDEEKFYNNVRNEIKKLDKYKVPFVEKKFKKRTLLNLFIKPKNIEYVCDDNTTTIWLGPAYTPKQDQPTKKKAKYDFDRRKYKIKSKKRR